MPQTTVQTIEKTDLRNSFDEETLSELVPQCEAQYPDRLGRFSPCPRKAEWAVVLVSNCCGFKRTVLWCNVELNDFIAGIPWHCRHCDAPATSLTIIGEPIKL